MKKPPVLFRKTKNTAILLLLLSLFLLCGMKLYAVRGQTAEAMAESGREYTPQSLFGLLAGYTEG